LAIEGKDRLDGHQRAAYAEKSPLDFLNIRPTQKEMGVGSGNEAELWQNLQSWVYACVDKRARAVADAKWRLVIPDREGRPQVVLDHPLYKLLKNPNDYMTQYQLKYITAAQMDTNGNSYWWLQPSLGSAVISIHPLFPDNVKTFFNNRGEIAHYTFRAADGKEWRIPPENIIHFKTPNPEDPKIGISVIRKAAYSVDANALMSQTIVSTLNNSSIPPGVLRTDQALNPNDIDMLRYQWEERYKGAGKAGKTAVLHKGLEYQSLNINLEDLMFIAGKKMAREEICAIFDVPLALLGVVEDVNRSNADYLERQFLNKTIRPILTLIEEPIEQKLLPRYRPLNLEMDFYLQLPRDAKTEAEVHQIYFNTGVLNDNEIREEINRPPREGGDDYYLHTGVLPEGMTPTQQPDDVGHTPGVGQPAKEMSENE